MPVMRLAYYVTPHGFGHAVRSIEIIRALRERWPGVRITAVSDLPDFLFEEAHGGSIPQRRRRLDVGLVQRDSLRYDLPDTLTALDALFSRFDSLVREEAAFLRDGRFDGLVSDAGYLPFAAARLAGLPSVGVGNFTWDWIYETYAPEHPAFRPFIGRIREEYAACGLFLRLPMWGGCDCFPNVEPVPLVARRSRLDPAETRALLGIRPGQKACLMGFTDFNPAHRAGDRLEALKDVLFFYKKPIRLSFANARRLDGLPLAYEDVVAAMDAVVTKPGYGIVADCLAHGVPMLYCDRGAFREYPVLVEVIERELCARHVPAEALREGAIGEALEALWAMPPKRPSMPMDGARVCARRIGRELGWEENEAEAGVPPRSHRSCS